MRLALGESYSSITLQYMRQLASSVEATGAVLISNGDCTLIDATIAANISIRSPQSEGYSFSYNMVGIS